MKFDTDRPDPFKDEPSALKRGWLSFKRFLDFVIWVHEQLMIYACFFLLAPMLLVVALNVVVDVRPWVKANINLYFGFLLAGIPVWMMICGYAELGKSQLAQRIKRYQWVGVMVVGSTLLIGGGIAWLLGWMN